LRGIEELTDEVMTMQVVKNINNNVSLCLDNDGHEVIVFGKGIGFVKPPHDIPLESIQRTFYDISTNYLSVIAQIDTEILDVATDIVDFAARKLGTIYSSNVVFTLADHIQFAIKRKKENISVKLPLYYEVKNLYPKEMKIGVFAVSLIKSELDVELPLEEAASITLHLINYGIKQADEASEKQKNLIERCTQIIEETMEIQIDKRGFNYSRFVTHMYYLLERLELNEKLKSLNESMLDSLKKEYPKTYECALLVRKEMDVRLTKDELVYLILHINRLCSREDCYQ